MDVAQVDSSFEIQLSDDRLSASITIYEDFQTFSVTFEQLLGFVLTRGIQSGIHEEILHDIINSPLNYISKNTIIASGVPPQDGRDSYEEIVYKDVHSKKGPVILDDGRVDYHEVNQIENVTAGQRLVKKHAATPGVHGLGVDGKVIPARDGKDMQIMAGKNVQLSEDKMELFSSIDGQVSITENNKINVFPVYEVDSDVDFSVGNIQFLGTIVVRGNVLPGFKLTAAGDVRIYGSIESSEIKAEGSIEIISGIIGHHKAFVMAGVDIKTSFAQEATLIAKRDVEVAQSILHCSIQAGGTIKCMGVKGLIVGGVLQANHGVAAKIIGNTMSTTTAIEVGALPELRINISALSDKLAALHKNLEKTEQAISLLEQMYRSHGSLSPEKKAMLIKLTNTRASMLEDKSELETRLSELELAWEDSEKANVITSVIYPGTKITIGRAIKYITSEMSSCHFVYDGGDVINRSEGTK